MSAIVVIPARYDSTRFPGKPLAPLKGIPVIQHVYKNSKGSRLADDVVVATDNKMIFEKVISFGGKAVMTSGDHISGTDRTAEAVRTMDYDIIVNVQGDEPLIRPEMIDDVISLLDDSRASIGTLAIKIKDQREIFDPNVVKVVFDNEGFAFYFSRAPIPYHRDEWKDLKQFTIHDSRFTVFKHIGIYSYRKDVLLSLAELPPSRLEQIEKLEQLRAIENGFKIKVRETFSETFGVDTPQDLERIEKWLNTSL
ncbi:MAG: 3-deoxy-manno-octulosonate cytidylyltransferase [Nitrospirae bacterium GWC2_42_7]|nr:MAG: 3-deoxy-manno-octulosonate cytidylyltransferase [Nitrospirae bacterium GWC2_42_7]